MRLPHGSLPQTRGENRGWVSEPCAATLAPPTRELRLFRAATDYTLDSKANDRRS